MVLLHNFVKLMSKVYGKEVSLLTVKTGKVYRREVQLREHKTSADYNPNFSFSLDTEGNVVIYSTEGSVGNGYLFIVFPKNVLHGRRIRIRWKGEASYTANNYIIRVMDGAYDRTSDEDFPSGSGLPEKGAGTLYQVNHTSVFDWEVFTTDILDLTSAQYDYVTLFVYISDYHAAQWYRMRIAYIEVYDDNLGVIERYRFNNVYVPIVMERTGTTGDYGVVGKVTEVEPDSATPLENQVSASKPVLIGAIGENDTPVTYDDYDLYETYDVILLNQINYTNGDLLLFNTIPIDKDMTIKEVGIYALIKGADGNYYAVLIARDTISKTVYRATSIRIGFRVMIPK